VSERVYAIILDKTRRVLSGGHSTIVDAVFANLQERVAIADVAKFANVPLQGLFLRANLATRLARVGARGRDASDSDETVARAQERYDLGALDWTPIDASGTPEETLARTRAALAV